MSGRFLVPVQVAVRLCAKFCYRQELDEIKRGRSVGISAGGLGGFLSFSGGCVPCFFSPRAVCGCAAACVCAHER